VVRREAGRVDMRRGDDDEDDEDRGRRGDVNNPSSLAEEIETVVRSLVLRPSSMNF
jgi:hypothetical protein